MKVRFIVYYLFLKLGIISFSACETVVDIELDNQVQPVLNCLLLEDTTFNAFLFESVLYTETDYIGDELKDAEIVLKYNNTSTDMPYISLSDEEAYFLPVDGIYSTNLKPEQGTEYTIEATLNGKPTITAKCTFPYQTNIEQVDTSIYFGKLDPLDFDDEAENYLRLNIKFNNEAGQKNYYGIKIRNQEGQNPYFVLPDLESFEEDIPYYRGARIFSDEFFSNGLSDLELWVDYYSMFEFENDPDFDYPNLEVVLLTLNEEMYNYLYSSARQTNSSGFLEELFFEPVNVYSNVNNGLGIFAAISGDTLVLEM